MPVGEFRPRQSRPYGLKLVAALLFVVAVCYLILPKSAANARSRHPKDALEDTLHEIAKFRDGEWTVEVPVFYIYDEPAITMNNWDRVCDGSKWDRADHLLMEALKTHPQRTQSPSSAKVFVVPTAVYQSFKCGPELAHTDRLNRAISKLLLQPWFKRKQGRDHLMAGTHWTRNEEDKMMFRRWRRFLHDVMMTRFHVDKRGYAFTIDQPTDQSIMIPYATNPVLPLTDELSFEEWTRRKILVFYHPDESGVSGLRKVPFSGEPGALEPLKSWASCSIGGGLSEGEWASQLPQSQFCLVIDGATEHTVWQDFYHAVHVGCIPVVVGDDFGKTSEIFDQDLILERLGMRMSEEDWSSGGMDQLVKLLEGLDVSRASEMLRALQKAQPMLLWRHPRSTVADAVLKRMMAAPFRARGGVKYVLPQLETESTADEENKLHEARVARMRGEAPRPIAGGGVGARLHGN